jgi:hypothetical protein
MVSLGRNESLLVNHGADYTSLALSPMLVLGSPQSGIALLAATGRRLPVSSRPTLATLALEESLGKHASSRG